MRGAELESLLLGALLDSKEPGKLIDAAGLTGEDLTDPLFRACWDIAGENARAGRRCDASGLVGSGVARKLLRGDELAALQALQSRNTLDFQAAAQLAQDVRRAAHRRKIAAELQGLGKEVFSGAVTPETALGRFTAIADTYRRLHAQGRTGAMVAASAWQSIEQRKREGKSALLPSGIPLFDEQVGGLPPKMVLLVGEPGTGKSAVVGAAIKAQAAAKIRGLLFSLEDGSDWLVMRLLAERLGLSLRQVRSADFPDVDKAHAAMAEIAELLGEWWIVTKEQARTTADIVRIAVQHVAQHGVQCIWLDNATGVEHRSPGKNDTRNIAVSEMYGAFAEFSNRYHVPFVVLAHTGGKYQERRGKGAPLPSDAAWSQDAGRDARLALGLWQKQQKLRLTVTKNTEGPSGVTMEFAMHAEAALLDPASGEVVNLHAEAAKESAARKARKSEESVQETLHKRELRAKFEAAMKARAAAEEAKKPKEEPVPQLELIPGGKPEVTT